MNDDIDYAEVNYDNCLDETALAVLIAIDTAHSVWVPRSVLDNGEQIPVVNDRGGEHGACFVKTWFADKWGMV